RRIHRDQLRAVVDVAAEAGDEGHLVRGAELVGEGYESAEPDLADGRELHPVFGDAAVGGRSDARVFLDAPVLARGGARELAEPAAEEVDGVAGRTAHAQVRRNPVVVRSPCVAEGPTGPGPLLGVESFARGRPVGGKDRGKAPASVVESEPVHASR